MTFLKDMYDCNDKATNYGLSGTKGTETKTRVLEQRNETK
jgi:hypothetical protein